MSKQPSIGELILKGARILILTGALGFVAVCAIVAWVAS